MDLGWTLPTCENGVLLLGDPAGKKRSTTGPGARRGSAGDWKSFLGNGEESVKRTDGQSDTDDDNPEVKSQKEADAASGIDQKDSKMDEDGPYPVSNSNDYIPQLFNLLKKGGKLTKFGQCGRGHEKYIGTNSNTDKLIWSNSKDFTKPHFSVNFSEVVAIFEGKKSRAFNLNTEQVRALPDPLCFSVVTQDRTIDLKAKTVAERNAWLQAIQAAVMKAKGISGPMPLISTGTDKTKSLVDSIVSKKTKKPDDIGTPVSVEVSNTENEEMKNIKFEVEALRKRTRELEEDVERERKRVEEEKLEKERKEREKEDLQKTLEKEKKKMDDTAKERERMEDLYEKEKKERLREKQKLDEMEKTIDAYRKERRMSYRDDDDSNQMKKALKDLENLKKELELEHIKVQTLKEKEKKTKEEHDIMIEKINQEKELEKKKLG